MSTPFIVSTTDNVLAALAPHHGVACPVTRRCVEAVIAGMFNWTHDRDLAHVGFQMVIIVRMLTGKANLHAGAFSAAITAFEQGLDARRNAVEAELEARRDAIRHRMAAEPQAVARA